MRPFRRSVRLCLASALLLISTSCGEAPPASAPNAQASAESSTSSETSPDALAMVNSKAITRADMELALATEEVGG